MDDSTSGFACCRLPLIANVGHKKEMHPLMNDAKWEELRLAMYGLAAFHPQWRTKTFVLAMYQNGMESGSITLSWWVRQHRMGRN
jgi:hypothetical protein